MGGHPYGYFVAYEADILSALQKLRGREFQAGRYNPVVPFLDFPETSTSESPGAKHKTIAEAMEAADADGTRSILDINCIGSSPDFFTATPLPDAVLQDLYETTKPTRAQLLQNMDFLEDLDRGHAVYVIVYEGDVPSEIYFAGYSFD